MTKRKCAEYIVNLINNAIHAVILRREKMKEEEQYQPQIKVSTSTAGDGVRLEVEDNGIGMDDETMSHVFEPLFTTKAQGTGLGLAIVQKIIEEHGGSVSLKSALNRGTKVTVIIPIDRASYRLFLRGWNSQRKGAGFEKEILLVDDNEEFLDSTKDVLEDEGYEVFTAKNGEDAIRMVGERPFEVILMDIKMSGLSGVETFIEIKKINPAVNVIMVTAYSVESLIRQALEEGAYAFLDKPLDLKKLLGLIKQIKNAKMKRDIKNPWVSNCEYRDYYHYRRRCRFL